MAQPLDAILAIHNAFRRDMEAIDAVALDAARGTPGVALTAGRFQLFSEILDWHAKGEELAIFPALEAVAPSVAEAYERDHRGLEAGIEVLRTAVSAGDTLETARATAALRFHHDMHLGKEDAHLYRLIRERVSLADQGKALGMMSSTVPQDRFPDVVAWMFPLLGNDDRENMTRIWQMVLPAPAFAQVKGLIQQAVGDGWAELIRRIPTLA
jgi:hypothetical protein